MRKASNIAIYLLLALWFFSNFGGSNIDGGSKAPFPTDALSMLIVEEAQERQKLPESQQELLGGTEWRKELPTDRWRIFDEEVVIKDREDQWVKDAMQAWSKEALQPNRDPVPWLLLSNGKTGYSGPLVADEKSLIDLINKYEAN